MVGYSGGCSLLFCYFYCSFWTRLAMQSILRLPPVPASPMHTPQRFCLGGRRGGLGLAAAAAVLAGFVLLLPGHDSSPPLPAALAAPAPVPATAPSVQHSSNVATPARYDAEYPDSWRRRVQSGHIGTGREPLPPLNSRGVRLPMFRRPPHLRAGLPGLPDDSLPPREVTQEAQRRQL
eukprot:TRINITY_DN20496_c0_g1_i1.p1 TRINITY_DN20496_c0_g1~~TRINITY_DN20496_c0_g1_i1.p1  ORF type:complete len:178 (+),score=18.62 TRINITY_DN20496_c0_g1_i1:29-562(+)